MKATFGAVKPFRQCYGSPPPGNFAVEPEPPREIHWDHCREQFAVHYTQHTQGFYFSHPPEKGEDVASFLVKCERILGIEELKTPFSQSVFGKTGKQTVIWVEASRFWSCCPMRRSLITVFLRCGMNYSEEQDNFDEALFSEQFHKDNQYTRETRSATLRFLFGFTRYTGNFPPVGTYTSVLKFGWHEEFSKMDDFTVRKRLVLPEDEAPAPSLIGMVEPWPFNSETLWA